jgi:hypothetical protein
MDIYTHTNTILSTKRHMGTTVVDKQRGDIDKVITALKESLEEALASKKA